MNVYLPHLFKWCFVLLGKIHAIVFIYKAFPLLSLSMQKMSSSSADEIRETAFLYSTFYFINFD